MKGGEYPNSLAENQVCAILPNKQDTEECLTQIYRALYGDAMLVSLMRGTNIAAGNQQKPLSLRLVTTFSDHYLRNPLSCF